jgi:FlaA1/EpsC-like NDP-sugar epimerase
MTAPVDRDSYLQGKERAARDSLIQLPRRTKQLIMLVTDALGFIACVALCGWIQLIDPIVRADGLFVTFASLVLAHVLARYLGFYHSIVRYLGMGLLMAGARVAVGSAVALAALAWWAGITTQPFRLAVVYAAFCGLYLVGSRYFAQYFLVRRAPDKSNVIVYGAGESGARVAQAMHGNNTFKPVAFVDDDPSLHGKQLFGLPIRSRHELEHLISKYNVARVLLAMPSASRRHRQEIITRLEPFSVHVQTVPDFSDLISGKARVDDIREVDVEDLLHRAPVVPHAGLMQATVLDQTVLVTGAGGSIGSELCRQMLLVRPKRMVLFEISEVALYSIDMELRALARKLDIECEILPLLGSVQNESRLREVMQRFEVDVVYHAAAYKHVPMVEQNIIEGVSNNVLGTLRAATAAVESGVKRFILVSTDKAVSPTSVMGASKRFAELVLQAIQDRKDSTVFAMVRFGNVLESSGSVVPRFREQIRDGGPVTVTHPEIIRYFMTIPEAAQLVLQAGGMAKGGEVFVLDMGQPVKIHDLAVRMIHLMGLTVRDEDNPQGDIEISFTGLRPAEKLYEELLIGENATGTEHPRIMCASEDYLSSEELVPLLDELALAGRRMDRGMMRDVLVRAVKEYVPKNAIDDLVWEESERPDVEDDRKVVTLNPGTPAA